MEADTEQDTRPSSTSALQKRVPAWVALALLVALIVVIAIWQLAGRETERRFEAERQELTQKLEADRAAIQSQAREAIARQSEEAHILFGTALAWVVRSALMRNNMDEIDQYFSTLVKNERIKLALLASQDGKVMVSSDRQYQGSELGQHFPPALLEVEQVTVQREAAQNRLVLPIQGLSSRLGTALVIYTAPAPALQ